MSQSTKSDTTHDVLKELMVDASIAAQDFNHANRVAIEAANVFSTLHTLPSQIRKQKNAVAACVKRKGGGGLKLSETAKTILNIAPSACVLRKKIEQKEIMLAPSTMLLIDALGMRPHLFNKSKEAIEHAKTAEPFMVLDTLQSMTNTFVQMTTKREHLYREAEVEYQLNNYKTLLKTTFTDHALNMQRPLLTQFDLLPPSVNGSEPANLDHRIKQLVKGIEGLQNSLNEMVGKDNYLLAAQLMAYPSGVGIHCALMFRTRYQLTQGFVIKTLRQKWMQDWAGAVLYDTCFQGSPFHFRGMDAEMAAREPMKNRIANITAYFVRSIEVVASGWPSLHREKFLVGPLVRTQPSVKMNMYRTSSLQDFQTRVLSTSPEAPAVSGQPTLMPAAWSA